MLRIFAFCVIFSSFFTVVKADDRGFRFTPSFSSMVGSVDGKISMKTALNAELTYVLFNQLEIGFGAGYHRQHLTQSGEETFYISEEDSPTFTIPRAKADSIPFYGVLRYNFDIFEDGYFVASVKYGSYFLMPEDKLKKGMLPSTAEDEDSEAPILKYENRFSKMSFLAVTLGYDISNTVISLEYRAVNFNQNLTYIDETNSKIVEHPFKRTNHYIGVNVARKIDLF